MNQSIGILSLQTLKYLTFAGLANLLPIKDHAKEEAEDLEDFEATEADPEEKVKRDVRSVAKFIEVALVLDKAMFDKRPHSSRKDVIHDAIQVANIADLVSVFLSGTSLERVPRVPRHPLRFSNGCQVPVLIRAKAY